MTRQHWYGGNHLLILATALILLISAGATAAAVAMSSEPIRVTLNDRPVVLRHSHTIAAALSAATVTVRDGRLLSARFHRVLDEHAAPVQVLVNGGPARLNTTLRNGDRVEGRPGPDFVEPLVHRVLGGNGWGPGLPDIERAVWRPGIPAGAGDVLVGERSHEIVSEVPGAVPASPDTGKVVELTFDDGPDPRWTPQILAVLASEGVRATFSDVGLSVNRHPDLVRQELAMGETVCNHTLHHNEHLDTAPLPVIEAEIDSGADAIRAATGQDPTCYRPPAGRWSPDVVAAAHARGERVLGYTVDPSDYLKPPPQEILARILASVHPGSVVILHDGGGDRSHTVAMLRSLIDALKAQDYHFTTMGDESPTTSGAQTPNLSPAPLTFPLGMLPIV